MMNYCNGVRGFINYTTSNPRNISEYSIRVSMQKVQIVAVRPKGQGALIGGDSI
jgi:hypothetical protein